MIFSMTVFDWHRIAVSRQALFEKFARWPWWSRTHFARPRLTLDVPNRAQASVGDILGTAQKSSINLKTVIGLLQDWCVFLQMRVPWWNSYALDKVLPEANGVLIEGKRLTRRTWSAIVLKDHLQTHNLDQLQLNTTLLSWVRVVKQQEQDIWNRRANVEVDRSVSKP